ncbi:MAG: glucose-1-phosphate thymidylyltransferase [Chitinophagaceae bacterium]|nr:glucose-1-phosphate thymidylyltransferase [Chitinophagaceae bacterium]
MDKIIFTEEFCQPENLHPFTLTRRIQDIRVGILTIRQKWEMMLGLPSFDKKEDDYKDSERAVTLTDAVSDGVCYMVHGNVLPTQRLVKAVRKLRNGEFLSVNGSAGIVFRFSKNEIREKHQVQVKKAITIREEIVTLEFPWNIFQLNDWAIRQDVELLTRKRKSQVIPKSNTVIKSSEVFLEKGAKVEHCILNASTGPIYIGKNAELMEGSMIRGPFAICEGSLLKMGARVYGATTIGPYCTAGGEIKNSMMLGYSNKSHDGYLGDSVIGEWCNLGAGTTNSNLKNNASVVRVWTPKGKMDVGNKCGVMMGDHSRTGVNTTINTGSVIGVCCNVFGGGMTPKYIPNFSWGVDGKNAYGFEKSLADIDAWKQLKNQELTENEKNVLKYIFEKF